MFYFVGTAETDCEPTLATGFPKAKAYETVLVHETESQQTTKTPSVLAGKGMQKMRICDLNARRDMSGRFRTEAICHGPQLIAFFGISQPSPLPENSPEKLCSSQLCKV